MMGQSGTLRAAFVQCVLVLGVVGCGGTGETNDGGADDGGPLPMGDAGPGVDGGPIVPPYVPVPLQCRGTASECREADGSQTTCESIQGCDYGFCSYRPIACYAAVYSYQCESGCDWDGDFETVH